MALRPLGNRVVVERMEVEETVSGGIIIPDSAKQKGQSAKIIAVGSGVKKDDGGVVPLDVNVGDTVLIDKYAGNDVNVAGNDYVIIAETEILGVIES